MNFFFYFKRLFLSLPSSNVPFALTSNGINDSIWRNKIFAAGQRSWGFYSVIFNFSTSRLVLFGFKACVSFSRKRKKKEKKTTKWVFSKNLTLLGVGKKQWPSVLKSASVWRRWELVARCHLHAVIFPKWQDFFQFLFPRKMKWVSPWDHNLRLEF